MITNITKNIGILIMTFMLSFFAVSCEEDDTSDNNEYGPIESNILFTFAPDSADGIGTTESIVLYLKTELIYGCMNYEIVYERDVLTDRIDVDLEGIHLPGGICATALGPARAKIPLGITYSEFILNFTYDSSTDNYNVSIPDSLVVVVPIDTNFTHYVEYLPGQWW